MASTDQGVFVVAKTTDGWKLYATAVDLRRPAYGTQR
jgi:hypothetical protein